jgi:hypothetical protein
MVLGVHRSMEHLTKMEKVLKDAYPAVQFHKATTYEEGLQLMLSYTFDLVISETRLKHGSDLIDLASRRNFPVVIISENGRSAEALRRLYGSKIKAVSSKQDTIKTVQRIGEILKVNKKLRLQRIFGKIISMCHLIVDMLSPKTIDPKYCELPNNGMDY